MQGKEGGGCGDENGGQVEFLLPHLQVFVFAKVGGWTVEIRTVIRFNSPLSFTYYFYSLIFLPLFTRNRQGESSRSLWSRDDLEHKLLINF